MCQLYSTYYRVYEEHCTVQYERYNRMIGALIDSEGLRTYDAKAPVPKGQS